VSSVDRDDTYGMIEAQQLTKQIGGNTIVENISFRCEPGTVTGFLGPNGAGKSTTMRMLVGLARPTSGSSLVCDAPYVELPNPGRQVGILLDATAQHPGRTGRETLVQGAMAMGIDAPDIDALLDRVGLDRSASRKRIGQYSLGMRQRIGLAHALLGDPHVLILDEPANGLDPEGMRWMRHLLRDFADRGGTVLLSSHLLHEVRAVADQFVFIGSGRIVAAGRPDELLDMTSTVVRSSNDSALIAALVAAGMQPSTNMAGDVLVSAPADQVGRIALAAELALQHLAAVGDDGLEQLFFDLTSTAQRAGAPA